MLTRNLLLSTLAIFASLSTAVPLNPRTTTFKQVENAISLQYSTSSKHKSNLVSLYSSPEGQTDLITTGVEFLAEISFGSQSFQAVLDTGSSDTWIASSDFQCVDLTTGEPVDQSVCDFPALYTPDSDFHQIQNQNLNGTYGSGEFIAGIVGTVPVTIADITVPSQEVGVITLAAFSGDGVASGIIGLAYPGITSSFPGTDPSTDDPCSIGETDCNEINYSSLTNTIFNVDKLTDPVFSLALSRDVSTSGNGGVFALGGTPDLSAPGVNSSDKFATTDIAILPMDDKLRYYTIVIDGLTGSWGDAGSGDCIVDSGTTLNYFPPEVADAIAAAYDPPAEYSPNDGVYIVDCDAVPPSLGVTIGGQTFYTNPIDMILDGGDGSCASGVTASSEIFILGDTFLKNVLAVFDVGNTQMAFASREYYES